MDKQYHPVEIEEKWSKVWSERVISNKDSLDNPVLLKFISRLLIISNPSFNSNPANLMAESYDVPVNLFI